MLIPGTATEAFESFTGVDQVRKETRVSALLKHPNIMQYLVVERQHEEDDNDDDNDEEAQGLLETNRA